MAEEKFPLDYKVAEVADILRVAWNGEVGKFETCEYGVRFGGKNGELSMCTTGGCQGRLLTCSWSSQKRDKPTVCYPADAWAKFREMQKQIGRNATPESGAVEVRDAQVTWEVSTEVQAA